MYRLLAFVILCVVALSCTSKKYPKVVYNKCTNKWAIRTGYGLCFQNPKFPGYLEDLHDEDLYYRTMPRSYWFFLVGDHTEDIIDTIENASVTFAETFDDSLTAEKTLKILIARRRVKDSIAVQDKIAEAIKKKSEDSAFKCKFTYE